MYDNRFENGHVTCTSTLQVTVVSLGRNILTYDSRGQFQQISVHIYLG